MPRQILSKEIIIQTSISLIEANKDNSFANIARNLGTQSQALYNYFSNQIDLNYAIVAWTIKQITQHLQQKLFGKTKMDAIIAFAMELRKLALDHFLLAQFILKMPRTDKYPDVKLAFTNLKALLDCLIATEFTDRKKRILASRCGRDLLIGDIINVGTGWFVDKSIPTESGFRTLLKNNLENIKNAN